MHFLLSHGANPSIKTKGGHSAIEVALSNGHFHVVRSLEAAVESKRVIQIGLVASRDFNMMISQEVSANQSERRQTGRLATVGLSDGAQLGDCIGALFLI